MTNNIVQKERFRYFIKVPELAALDRKIQLELAPPTPEVTQQAEDGQQMLGENMERTAQAEQPAPGINRT